MSFKNIINMHVYILLLLITNQNKIARMLLIFWTRSIFSACAATSIKYSHALISQRNGTMKQLRALGGNTCFVNLLRGYWM